MPRPARTAATVLAPESICIPGALLDLSAFRRWVQSTDFPDTGRIDWIDGDLEVDMSPEEINTHGTPKVAIARTLGRLVEDQDLGVVLVASTRISCPEANLSVEPDVVVVLFRSVDQGRVTLVRAAGSTGTRCVEIQGAPDLVVECVSDSSVAKDRLRLRSSYAIAGISEYWIVDARRSEPMLTVLRLVQRGYREVRRNRDGYVRSTLLGLSVRLERQPPRSGLVRYRLAVP
ncbi:MAG: Uma2 family endonuclease [Candidatus Riflebacteria bacterium]|nr:Uma2 family endonuclease [Candidatus Riflebacteria bacterium]